MRLGFIHFHGGIIMLAINFSERIYNLSVWACRPFKKKLLVPSPLQILFVPVQHETPKLIWALGLELQLYSTAHGPNPLVRNWALSLLRPWAWAS